MNAKQFDFADEGDDTTPASLTVVIHEDLDHVANDNYGCYTWISAPVLAHYVWRNRKSLQRRHVLEIGAGAALPGIVAGLCGGVASLTLADSRAFHPAATRLARRNADANGLAHARVIDVTWGLVGSEMMESTPTTPKTAEEKLFRYDIILASDCFYDTSNFEDVVVTFATLLHNSSPDTSPELWMTYQERSSGRSIRHLLTKYRLRCVQESSWREFRDSSSCVAETRSLQQLDLHHQISSVWILVIRKEE